MSKPFFVTGIKAMQLKIAQKLARIEKATLKGNIKGAGIVERFAKKDVPRRTGNLSGSIFSIWKNRNVTDISFQEVGRDVKGRFVKKDDVKDAANSRKLAERIRSKIDPTSVAVAVGANYGLYIHELGGKGGRGRKFLDRAVKNNKDLILRKQAEEMRKA